MKVADLGKNGGWFVENKKDIVKRLKLLLMATRAGSGIVDLILNEQEDNITILFESGSREVNIQGDSGYGIIMDVMKRL